MANTLTFKPKQVTKHILSGLPPRAHEVIVNRFGLADDAQRKTLEAIGQKYGITRERVRQIENSALNLIRKSESFKSEKAVFEELKKLMHTLGAIVSEQDLLNHISKDKIAQNHINLYLTLSDAFTRHKEDNHFKSRWSVDNAISEEVHKSLKSLYEKLSDDELVHENDLIARFLDEVKNLSEQYKNEEIARRWLNMSKMISKNPLGEWGKSTSSGIKTRGIKDYAFLMMRKHGSPMHFREVAKAITETFNKKCHTATCHNELIKDPRFVLVGRGIYALSEWGYKSGVVRDVIKELLKKNGPMSKDDIVNQVMKERYLKKNTILVNLQNSKYFKKNKNGLYSIA
ncbi:MAG TPA: sigma factor-like helix-turn-helix DNA-binding protein [Candidatus Paceibacterota bacterium]|jgi:DNA-directed RNA polymerase delta subunit|nr:sigma factor-like helix-turn-helix DNA-binding protein [Candidatus Paceibacterota bacterium]